MASLLAAALIVASSGRIGWLLGGAIAAATAVGYCLSRTTGLPHADDDIGNWTEPLGVASFIAEGAVMLLAAGYVTITRRPQTPAASRRQVHEPVHGGPPSQVGRPMTQSTPHSGGWNADTP